MGGSCTVALVHPLQCVCKLSGQGGGMRAAVKGKSCLYHGMRKEEGSLVEQGSNAERKQGLRGLV